MDDTKETLTERVNRLTKGMSDTDIAAIMGVTEGAVRKLRDGRTQSFDLFRALKLCERLGVDPWYLAFGRSRPTLASLESAPGPDVVETLQAEIREIRSVVAATQQTEAETQRKIEALTTLIEGLLPPQR